MCSIIVTFLVAAGGAGLAKRMKLPAPGMTGSMLAVSVVSICTGYMHFPMSVKVFAQIITGAYIGQQISRSDLRSFPVLYKPIILLLGMLCFNTFFMGFVISSLCGIDLTTALISCVSGGVMDMSLISMDMGADTNIVAFMQLIRLCGILLILPYWVKLLCRHYEEEETEDIPLEDGGIENVWNRWLSSFIRTDFQKFMFTFLLCAFCGYLGYLSGIPAGALTASMLMSILLKVNTTVTKMPFKVRYFAQILAGALVGCSFSSESVALLKTLFIPAVLLLLSYLILNYIYARISLHFHFLDFRSSLFASSPAGASDISLIAGEFGADMPKIAIIQITRLVFSIAVMPLLIKLLMT